MATQPHDNRILTVPREEGEGPYYRVTGNAWLALPAVDALGRIWNVNVLHMGALGLLEWAAEPGTTAHDPDRPLIEPYLAAGGKPLDLDGGNLTWEEEWLPVYRRATEGLRLELRLAVPPDEKGLLVDLAIENRGERRVIDAGFRGSFGTLYRTAFRRRRVEARVEVYEDDWAGGLVFEARSPWPFLALALRLETGAGIGQAPLLGGEGEFPNGEPHPWSAVQSLVLEEGERRRVTLFAGVNLDGEGAALTALHLARRGRESLWLAAKAEAARLTPAWPAGLPGRSAFQRNLLFNHYFSRGKTLDTGETVLVTSRSPRYYVSAAHWSRDSLLWSFPGLLLANRETAREALLTAFRRYSRHPGIHAQYINGEVLYPGFELDQLAAFPIALARYVDATGDRSPLDSGVVKEALPRILASFEAHRDADLGVYDTFLLSSDDPAHLPFVTYSNVLVWRAYRGLQQLLESGVLRVGGWDAGALGRRAQELEAAIWRHCVIAAPDGGERLFAYAVGKSGESLLYDEPPGSLLLLPHYGFCPPDHPVYESTAAWVFSERNPNFLGWGEAGLPQAACPHARHPWILAFANLALARPSRELLEYLAALPMDGGLACETVDRSTGRVRTGRAFATAAGFLASALYELAWKLSHADQNSVEERGGGPS